MPNYQETVEYLFSRLPMFTRVGGIAYKKDLGNTLALCEILNNPHKTFPSIHVAGTNGKGSSSHMLASVFQAQGLKTGLYTSPHLRDFRERIRIDGEMISEEEVIAFTSRMQSAVERIEPSFFELTVAMAFDHFRRHEVDVGVIETGMGGRLDSTNIIKPEVCLITNIGYDHMEFLGNTLDVIAGEKAGIIKPGVPVVIGRSQPETRPVFLQRAQEMNASITFADQVWQVRSKGKVNRLHSISAQREGGNEIALQLDLLGDYQLENVAGVLEVFHWLEGSSLACCAEAIQKGLSSVQSTTGLMGRWQKLSDSPRVICDTGHNEDGIKQVLHMIGQERFSRLHFVLGVVRDKDISKILRLLPATATYYFTQAAIPRALPAEELAAQAAAFGLRGTCIPVVSEALASAKTAAAPDDLVFVGGSTFVVAETV